MAEIPRLTRGLIGAGGIAETRMLRAMRRMKQRVQGLAGSHEEHAMAFAARSHAHGLDGMHFFTRGKAITTRWLDPSHGGIELGFPQNT
jgi:predicted dehydrogenase